MNKESRETLEKRAQGYRIEAFNCGNCRNYESISDRQEEWNSWCALGSFYVIKTALCNKHEPRETF